MQNTIKSPAAESAKTPAAASSAPSAPISQAQQALRDMPEVDSQRVAELKAAIGKGELDTDPASLAKTMMDYYRR
ncbi:flagellar biosynthesis anti-sigma factor FlgM [Erwinia sp. SLM-02]|uniref:flagellar biosynthesis anti-sigma factor FlgM n=1 Tax=Erwinia sp. SLM-02 TaxID=3020057 RepID=UPI0028D588E7|nr:flagellar biosynthesis anti-sigma factor FlgM [uncultured Erwinia sp.]